jgi:Rrf2 family iron-sulfur cluster assembly transcriptional regulator|tara:strand:+ start:1163 stop:1597 length:435 start_codon:yes stop_codon:yes gene_type:complete
MKLTSKGRYAVMAMADLAKNDDSRPVSLKEISLRQGISIFYLEQLFLKLKLSSLVHSIRGSQGGYILSKPPDQIRLSSIISAVDEEVKTMNCNKNSKKGCNGKSIKCITHSLWDELGIYINLFFEKKSLKDVVNIEKNFQRIEN